MKKIIIILILISCPKLSLAQESFFSPGEYLQYEVSFAGIKLGYIKTYYEGPREINGKLAHAFKCDVGTYDDIPFVKFKSKILTCISEDFQNIYKYATNSYSTGSGWYYQEINYRSDTDDWKWDMWKNKKIEKSAVINHAEDRHDGFSILFYARYFSNQPGERSVSTMMDGDTTRSFFTYFSAPKSIKIEAIDYPIKTKYMKGVATWEGIYGLNGDYEGWFSDDEARVPIVANLNVFVGKVRVELVKWSRNGWKPPAFKKD